MCSSDSFSQFYPVTHCLGSLNLSPLGWSLSLRHLHYSGSWSDCSVDTFEALTTEELADVLSALRDNWPAADDLSVKLERD